MGQGVLEGTLLWTSDGPRPVEQVGGGERLVGFDAATFRRGKCLLRGIRRYEGKDALQLLVGGRLLGLAPQQPLTHFSIVGEAQGCEAGKLPSAAWLPVDRQVPLVAAPITLPDLDTRLTERLGEDAVALVDALHSEKKYFEEMSKRGLRLQLFELSGYILAVGERLGADLAVGEPDDPALAYYLDAFRRTLGSAERDGGSPLRRLRRWMGAGLRPPAERALPAWAYRLESQARAALLRGFFDGAGTVSEQEVAVTGASLPLLAGVQALLGSLGVEATFDPVDGGAKASYRLGIRNVRRFAEWIDSQVPEKRGLLRAVYRREPRYPSDSTAILPLKHLRPALERIRATHAPPERRPELPAPLEEELARVSTLRLLATAFEEESLRHLVNQQIYLEPVFQLRPSMGGTFFALELEGGSHFVANGIILGA